MTPKKEKQLNPKGVNQAVVILDLSQDPAKTMVGSEYSMWDCLFILLEGVAFLGSALIETGEKTSQEIGEKVNSNLSRAIQDYKYLGKQKDGSN